MGTGLGLGHGRGALAGWDGGPGGRRAGRRAGWGWAAGEAAGQLGGGACELARRGGGQRGLGGVMGRACSRMHWYGSVGGNVQPEKEYVMTQLKILSTLGV